MDDRFQSDKTSPKEVNKPGCCGTIQGIKILDSAPVFKNPTPCCSSSSGGANIPIESEAFSIGRKPAAYRILVPAAIVGISVLVLATGVLPGLASTSLGAQVASHLKFIGKAAWSILPFFLLSVGISAWVTVSGFSERIKAVFDQREGIAIAGAAVVGAIAPLCSCGVIPFIAALLSSGVPLGPVMAFWISSPLMSPSMFFLTAGALGMNYAAARLITAVLMGAGAGYLVYFISSYGFLNNQLHGLSLSQKRCCSTADKRGTPKEISQSKFFIDFRSEAWKISLFLGKWLLMAFILESLIVHYVDPTWISALLGRDRLFSIPLATAIGIPVYTSGEGAIPIVQGLLNSGMSPGAALAFLIAGPVTTIPAMTAVFALVKRHTFFIYLGVAITGSLIAGYLFQAIAW